MTETVATSILSGILTLMTCVLGYIANTLAGIRKDLNNKVDKDTCGHDMDRHCWRLDKLEENVRENSNAISALSAKIE